MSSIYEPSLKLLAKIFKSAKIENTLKIENKILTSGEMQLSKDRYEFGLPCIKIGDGKTPYNDLPFLELK